MNNTRLNHKQLSYLTGFDLEKWSFLTFNLKVQDRLLLLTWFSHALRSCRDEELLGTNASPNASPEPWGSVLSLGNPGRGFSLRTGCELPLFLCLRSPSSAPWCPHVEIFCPTKHLPALFWILSFFFSVLAKETISPFPHRPSSSSFSFHPLCPLFMPP